MGPILTLALKDVKLVMRDKFALFWVFAFPLMYALFFGSIFGGDGGDGTRGSMPVVLVDEDGSAESAALVERLADNSALRVDRDGETDDAPARLHTLDEARDLVRRGSRAAYIRVLPGFGASPWGMFGASSTMIEVGIDPARQAEAGMLQGVMMESVFGGMSDRFTDREWLAEQTDAAREGIAEADDLDVVQKLVFTQFMNALDTFFTAIDDEVLAEGPSGAMAGGSDLIDVVEVTRERGNVPRSTWEITFPTAMIWGLMSVALTFAITIVRERTQGTLLRLRVAPISGAHLLAGKALGCFLMCQVVMVFLLLVGTLALGVRIADTGLLVLSMVSIAACFTGLMMIASVMGKTEQAVAGASWGVMMPFAMIGGGMIPLIAMPSWLLALSDVSPFKWGILAMEGAIWRGFGLGDMLVPCAILVGIGAAFFAGGVWIFQRGEG